MKNDDSKYKTWQVSNAHLGKTLHIEWKKRDRFKNENVDWESSFVLSIVDNRQHLHIVHWTQCAMQCIYIYPPMRVITFE